MASLPLQGRTAIITVACGDIGHTIALQLASLGANLILGDLNSTQTELLASEINSSTYESHAIFVLVDVSNPTSIKSLLDVTESTFSSAPHILVTCAGISDPKAPTFAEASPEDG